MIGAEKVESKGHLLFTQPEIRAFLLGIRAAFLLASRSRSGAVSSYGICMLNDTDNAYMKRFREFRELLELDGYVDCGVKPPSRSE